MTWLPIVAIIVPVLLVLMGGMRKLGQLEAATAQAILGLEKSIDRLEAGLTSLAKIPELERRIGQLETALQGLSSVVGSLREFRAVTKEQIENAKEARRSSQDLSAHIAPPTPRNDR